MQYFSGFPGQQLYSQSFVPISREPGPNAWFLGQRSSGDKIHGHCRECHVPGQFQHHRDLRLCSGVQTQKGNLKGLRYVRYGKWRKADDLVGYQLMHTLQHLKRIDLQHS